MVLFFSVDRVIDKASEEAQAKAKAEAAEAKKSMLDRVVDEIGTKKKISSLTKSSYDWDKFKQDKGGTSSRVSRLHVRLLAIVHVCCYVTLLR